MELHIIPGGMKTASDPEIAIPLDQQAQKNRKRTGTIDKVAITGADKKI